MTSITDAARTQPVLLAYAFRPFFLLAGLYGALAIMAWMGYLFGGWALPLGRFPLQWHSHEMLFGLVPAAIAGFLLTAMSNWTGAPPLRGVGLLALLLLWLAGRVVMWYLAALPPWLVAAVDLAFLPVMALYVARVLLRAGNTRNLILVAVLGVLTLANALMHLTFAGYGLHWARLGELTALNVITVMLVVIAGRITPAFTANWLRMHGGDPAAVRQSDALTRYALIGTALMVPADLITGYPVLAGVAALAAAGLNAVRLVHWAGWRAVREPLLWILHVGYAWLVFALLLKGLAAFTPAVPATAWFHALGVGAIGTLILGVMTRVAVGHTGRPLKLQPFAILIYVGILAAAVVRVLVAFGVMGAGSGLPLSSVAWAAAFFLFVLLYWPILSQPRADGRPG